MRNALIAAMLATILLVWPAQAQIIPNPVSQPAPAAERVLLDATFWVNPPSRPSGCFLLGAGKLTVTTRISDPAIEGRPSILAFRGLMEDPKTNIQLRLSDTESSTTTQISGGRYCWYVAVEAPETEGMSNADRGYFTLNVDVRIALTPQ